MPVSVSLREVIESAPHVDPSIAESWLGNIEEACLQDVVATKEFNTTSERDAFVEKRMRWHIRRLSGFGGSDMAALYTEFKGGFYPFASSADVVRDKLCLNEPEGYSGHTERGIILEPIAQRKLLAKGAAIGLRTHPDAMDKLQKWMDDGGDAKHPWLKASPDGVYIDKNGKTYLVDFKVPNQHAQVLEYFQNPPDYYKAQLAQYKYALEQSGTKIDNVLLAPMSTEDMQLYDRNLEIEPQFTADMLACGDYYWEYVLKQELPKRPPSNNFESIDEVSDRLRRKLFRFSLLKKMESHIKKEAGNIKSTLSDEARVAGADLDEVNKTTRLPLIDIKVSEKETLNTKRVLAEFERMGGDLKNPEFFDTVKTETISLIRGQKNDHAPILAEIDDFASQSIESALMDLADMMGFEDNSMNDAIDSVLEIDERAELDKKPASSESVEPNF